MPVNEPAVAVNVVLVAPGATVADAGTLNPELLLESETTAPPDGAAVDKVMVQVDVAPAVRLVNPQVTELSVAAPVSDIVAVFEAVL